MSKDIVILGAGVSGLSTGILLLQQGYHATIWAKTLPPFTTSNKAAAVWYPFKAWPREKVTRWARKTLEYFLKNVPTNDETGCRKTIVTEIFDHPKADPWWKDAVPSYKRIDKEKVPHGYVDGYQIDGLVMDTDMYMNYLLQTFKKEGGKILQKAVDDIQEPLQTYTIVINCTGLGSRQLLDDKEVYPSRGQIVKIKKNDFDYSLFEQEGPNNLTYIIPRIHDTVVGGTTQNNDWNTEVDPKDTQDILSKCASLFPVFKHVEIIEERVGLRPARAKIRLEIEKRGDSFLVHNYGHGGSGFTLSWGCSQDVVDLVKTISE